MAFGITESVDTICCQISDMITEDYRSRAPLKEGVRAMLDNLKGKGIPMCIATATGRELDEKRAQCVRAALAGIDVKD